MANEPLPSDITYGYVVGRLVYAVADTAADPDPYPDGKPATGSVTFTPYSNAVISTNGAPPSTGVIPTKISSPLVNGYLTDEEGKPGIWLVAGLTYKVVISLIGSSSIVFDLAVTSAATALNPIDLVKQIPIVPNPTVKFIVNEQVYTDTLAARDQVIDMTKTKSVGTGFNLDTLEGNATVNGLAMVNAPFGLQEWFFVEQVAYSADPWGWRTQTATGFTSDVRNRKFFRTREESANPVWSPWREIPSATPVAFTAQRGGGYSIPKAADSAWNTIPLTVQSDTAGAWDAAANEYVIPETGTYLCTASVRVADGAGGANYAIGVAAANGDSELVFWYFGNGLRNTFIYTRQTFFAKGQRARMFMYNETSDAVAVTNASFGISKIGASSTL